jgi:hypothetical protein
MKQEQFWFGTYAENIWCSEHFCCGCCFVLLCLMGWLVGWLAEFLAVLTFELLASHLHLPEWYPQHSVLFCTDLTHHSKLRQKDVLSSILLIYLFFHKPNLILRALEKMVIHFIISLNLENQLWISVVMKTWSYHHQHPHYHQCNKNPTI